MKAVSARQHLPVLDGVRGLAILLVMLLHMAVFIPTTGVERAVALVLQNGWIGVDLFFVLSGFLITGILLDSRGDPAYFRNFYTRRVLRIFPLYYAVCFFSFVILPYLPLPSMKAARFATVGDDQWMYWTMLSNIALAKAAGPRHGIMDVTWSLAIEEQFYLLWPALVAFLSRRTLARFCVAVLLLGPLLRLSAYAADIPFISVYAFTLTHIDGLCGGALLAIMVRGDMAAWLTARRGQAMALIGLAAYVLLVLPSPSADFTDINPAMAGFGFTALTLLFCGVMVDALNGGPSARLLDTAPMRSLGKYSYALYLFHLPLRAVIRDKILLPIQFPNYPGGVFVGQFVFYIAAIGVSYAAAVLSYYLFERHFLKLRRFFQPRRAAQVDLPTAPVDAPATARA